MPDITRYAIEQWIRVIATGEFYYKNVLGLDRVLTPHEDGNLRKIMSELCHVKDASHPKDPICESVGRRDGWYRPIEEEPQPIDFSKSEDNKRFPIVLPFDLTKYVFIYPDNSIVVAGSKSSGKTGLLYRTIKLNWGAINIILLSNMEGGKDQMYDRFKAMDIDLRAVSPFIYPVSNNFHDFIKKENTLYVIDYIDAPEGTDFFLIGAAISKVNRKLQGKNSLAVIGLQKPSGRDTAYGGELTLKVAMLYLALDTNKLKIVDAKKPADKTIHPKNMQWTFTYHDEGTRFEDIKPYYGD